jgi:hypothetical protein
MNPQWWTAAAAAGTIYTASGVFAWRMTRDAAQVETRRISGAPPPPRPARRFATFLLTWLLCSLVVSIPFVWGSELWDWAATASAASRRWAALATLAALLLAVAAALSTCKRAIMTQWLWLIASATGGAIIGRLLL